MKNLKQDNQKVYCGIDFHKNTSTLCAKRANGEIVEQTTIRTERLVQYLSNRKGWRIGIEASGGANEVVKKLKESGHDVVIVNPNKLRMGIGGVKTDNRDANTLADALRLNFIPEVHHKSQTSREIKSLIVIRESFVRSRVNMTNAIRGNLREYGINIPQGVEAFWKEAGSAIEGIPNPILKESLIAMLKTARELCKKEEEVEAHINMMVRENPIFKLLQSIPGVGVMTSATMIAVVDDISRFESSEVFASYLGLVPRVSSSANKTMMGSITRSGSEILRRYLIHGARAWMKYAPDQDKNRVWAERVKDRRGFNKATVALAHKMARIAFAVWRDQSPYKETQKKELKETA